MQRWQILMLGPALMAAVIAGHAGQPRPDAHAAAAATIWDVQVGGDVPEEGIQTHAYYPRTLTIHAGDRVRWRFAGRASVTFDRFRPLMEHFVAGPEPGDLALGPGWFPSEPSGADAVYDGVGVANSGIPTGPLEETPPYQLTFTRPGLYPYVDIIHPGTAGVIQVLPRRARLVETPAEAAVRGRAEYATVLAAIRAQIADTRPLRQPGAAGTAMHLVSAGLSTGLGAGANRYQPAGLVVRRGDTVVWSNGDDYAPHTVTFTSGAPLPPFLEPRPGPSAPPLVVAPARSIGPSGGTVNRGEGLLNSGFIM